MTEREKIDSWIDGLDEYGEKIEDYGYWRADLRLKATIADELKRLTSLLDKYYVNVPSITYVPQTMGIGTPESSYTWTEKPKPKKKPKGMGNCGMCKYWKRESTDGGMICINPQSPMCGDWMESDEGCSCHESDD